MLWDSIEPPQVFPPPSVVWGGDGGGPLRPPPPDAYPKDPNNWGQQGNPPQSWNIPNPSAFPNNPMPNPMKSPWDQGGGGGGGNWNQNGQQNLQGGWMPGPQMPSWSQLNTNSQPIPSGNWNNPGVPNPSWAGQPSTSPGKSWATVVRPSDQQMQPGAQQGRPQPRFDPNTGTWGGSKIDQGTPWDVIHPPEENKPKGAEWNNQPSAYGFDQRSAEPMQQQQQQPWSQPPPDNSGMLWNGNKDGGQQESWGPGGGGQQNQPGPNSWDAPGGHNPYGHGGMGMGNQMQGGMPPGGQRPNPMWDNPNQSQGGSNVWQNPAAAGNQSWAGSGRTGYGNPVYSPTGSVQRGDYAKPAAPFTESNVWQDPASSVRKTAQPDKGTAIWGDPHQQVGDIKRWKSNSDEATPGANMSVGGQPATPGNGGAAQSSWPSGGTPATVQTPKTTPSASGWDAAPPGTPSTGAPSGGSWNNPTPTSASKPPPTGPGWPAEQGWSGNPKTSSSSPTKLSNGWDAPASGFSGEVARPTPVTSSGLPDTAGSDDVFGSNPTSPLSAGNGSIATKNGVQPRLSSFPALAQNIIKARPSDFDKPDSDHLQVLTNQIADQLRYAVTQDLLDLKILQTPLTQQQLLLLNQLLHRVSKFDSANKELKGFPDPRYQPLNPAQQQEYQRIQSEINHHKFEIVQLRKLIQAQAKPGSTPPDSGNASQDSSRLHKWQTEGKKDSPPAAELSAMNLNSSDLWAQGNKPNADWLPTSNADGSSKANNSPNSTNDAQGNQRMIQIMSRKNDNSESGGNDETASTRSGENGQQSSSVEKGPPEFKPGQPWIYPDIAQTVDDNTTPLDWKQNRNNTLSIADLGVDPEQRFSNASSIKSAPTPTKNGPGAPGNEFWGSGAMPGLGNSRPPSQMGNPMMNRGGNVSRSMNFNQSAFAPYSNMSAPMMGNGGTPWLVLTNIGMHADVETVKAICSRAGNIQTFSSPIGAQFAVIRFKDAALDKIVPLIQQELRPFGVGVQLARDHEVEHLLQTASNGPMMSQAPSMWDNRSWLPFNGPHMPPAGPPQFDMSAGLHGGPFGDMMGPEHHPF